MATKAAAAPAKAPVPTNAAAAAAAPPDVQPAFKPIPGRAIGVNRQGIPIQRTAAENGVDRFFIRPDLLKRVRDEGFSWEWKEETILGEKRSGVAATQAQVGWEPVMHESYPGEFAPAFDADGNQTKGPVRRDGLMLMERPLALTIEAMRDEKRKADERVGNAKNQYSRLNTSGASTAEFNDEAQRSSYIKQNVERVVMPNQQGGTPID
jgi:hypothetical protein